MDEQRTNGREALARVFATLGHEGPAVTDQVWEDFRLAVAAAAGELRGAELRGMRHWQEVRHGQSNQ